MRWFRVEFPRTGPWVRDALLTVCGRVASKLPSVKGAPAEFVQFRSDSGPERGVLKSERYGVNVYAKSGCEALAKRAMGAVRRAVDGSTVVAVGGLSGPFEVVAEGDEFDAWEHWYFTVELTVRGVEMTPAVP